ncbi:MAG: hypothetical protein Alpg2KO_08640 [Alphaproteobacteria bacterium]
MGQKLLAAGRIFASHHQFALCADPTEIIRDEDNWSEAKMAQGFAGSPSFRMIGTEAGLNDHWIELVASHEPPSKDQWQRITAVDFRCATGKAHVMSVMDDTPPISAEIPPGDYIAFIAGQNIGIDQSTLGEDAELTDAELSSRRDLEWYRIYLLRGKAELTGRLIDRENPLPLNKQAK